eukprot:5705904-Amphidinium_carterae.1
MQAKGAMRPHGCGSEVGAVSRLACAEWLACPFHALMGQLSVFEDRSVLAAGSPLFPNSQGDVALKSEIVDAVLWAWRPCHYPVLADRVSSFLVGTAGGFFAAKGVDLATIKALGRWGGSTVRDRGVERALERRLFSLEESIAMVKRDVERLVVGSSSSSQAVMSKPVVKPTVVINLVSKVAHKLAAVSRGKFVLQLDSDKVTKWCRSCLPSSLELEKAQALERAFAHPAIRKRAEGGFRVACSARFFTSVGCLSLASLVF